MHKKVLLLAAFLLSGSLSFAQRTFSSAPTDSSAAKKPTQIIVTSTNASEYFGRSARTTKKDRALHTSVKLNPLLIICGDIPVYVEHKIGQKITAEVSLGMTYDNPLVDILDTKQYQYDESLVKQSEMGYSYSVGMRYYPTDTYETMEGYYFAPEFRHRTYNSTAQEWQGYKLPNIKQQRNINDFKLVFGYTDYFEDHIFWDVYGGIGMRRKEYKNMVGEGDNIFNPQTQTSDPYKISNESKMSPVFSLGVKLGFAF